VRIRLRLTFQALFIVLAVLCMIGPLAGIGHKMSEFDTLTSLRDALLVTSLI
jgi:hypothetical protein